MQDGNNGVHSAVGRKIQTGGLSAYHLQNGKRTPLVVAQLVHTTGQGTYGMIVEEDKDPISHLKCARRVP